MSIRALMNEKHDTKREGTGKQEMFNVASN